MAAPGALSIVEGLQQLGFLLAHLVRNTVELQAVTTKPRGLQTAVVGIVERLHMVSVSDSAEQDHRPYYCHTGRTAAAAIAVAAEGEEATVDADALAVVHAA